MSTAATDTRGDSLWVNLDIAYPQIDEVLCQLSPHDHLPPAAWRNWGLPCWNMLEQGKLDPSHPWSFEVSAEADEEYQELYCHNYDRILGLRTRMGPGKPSEAFYQGEETEYWHTGLPIRAVVRGWSIIV